MKKIYLILAIISIVTTTSIFLPAITKSVTVDEETVKYVYYGFDVTFGKSNIPDATGNTYGASITTSIPFSIFSFIAYFLPLIVLIIEILFKKNNQTALIILSLSFLISAILLLIITSITNIKVIVDSGSYYDIQKISFAKLKFRFSYSTIIGGITSLIGCVLAGFKGIENKDDETKGYNGCVHQTSFNGIKNKKNNEKDHFDYFRQANFTSIEKRNQDDENYPGCLNQSISKSIENKKDESK